MKPDVVHTGTGYHQHTWWTQKSEKMSTVIEHFGTAQVSALGEAETLLTCFESRLFQPCCCMSFTSFY